MITRCFSIARIGISLEYDEGPYTVVLDRALRNFSVEATDRAEIKIRVDTVSPFPSIEGYRQIFTSNPNGLWTVLEDKAKSHYIIALQNTEQDDSPYKIVRADRKFTEFLVHTKPSERGNVYPLEYPLDELIVSGHLNINRIGIILHSACVDLRGKGLLFSGVSGAGKSTISEIWRKDSEAEVLTDERVIIREVDEDLWAYGTPWHGTAELHKNAGVPIERIFFIRHGQEDRATPIRKREAANRLMVRCFPTFWNKEGMQFSIDFCSTVAVRRECLELAFLPEMSVTEYVKSSLCCR